MDAPTRCARGAAMRTEGESEYVCEGETEEGIVVFLRGVREKG